MRQDILTWGIALMLGVPVVAIALNEVIERLQRQNIPFVETLQHLRNLVLPFLTAWLVMRQILSFAPSGNFVRIGETLFWVAIIYTGLSFLNTTLTPRKKPKAWQIRVPNLYFLLARASVVLLIGVHILANIWKIDLAQITTALGVGSLVVALALQDTLSNLVSGFLLLLERPFEEGDWIKISPRSGTNFEGEVIEMNWRAVRLRTRNKDIIVIPNGELGKTTFENYTLLNPIHAERVFVKFSYNDLPNHVIDIIKKAALETPGIIADPEPNVRIKEYGDFFINYEIKIYINNYPKKDDIRGDLLKIIYYAAKRHKLTIPLPTQMEYSVDQALLKSEVPQERVLEYLEALPYLAFLDPSTINKLARHAIVEEYGVGECIIKAGNIDKGFFIVWDGCVRLSVKNSQGKEQEVFRLSSGDCFGEMSLLAGQRSLVTVTVVQDLQAIAIPTEVIIHLAEHSAKFALEINRLIEERDQAIKLVKGIVKTF
ncbi:mechanosensitive ion channel family protein [Anabaena sp. UHCC 0399]|uniref:mechanosensitive ion channel family protein n=1 Tax=Anabaena sp. UHCC 0399 TaxID=3110238 RepID=UPI002B218141|nr:mechanosensitive ion channel family protein [Anabaena sp. UHCC 0399]MEA5567862.1 mechanosensitive ion channel family protein [Anabaena sp. UHCC 0399]